MTSATTDPLGLLLDPAVGVVRWSRQVPPDPASPRSLRTWSAHMPDVPGVLGWPADRYGTGTAFDDDDRARLSAVGEAVERYCANRVPDHLPKASYEELTAAGRAAVDPAALLLYSEGQYAEPGCPFVRFTRDLPVRWAPGHDLTTGEPTAVPASLVWVNYFTGPRLADEPPTNFCYLAGIAAGPDSAFAETSALEELIERDATMIWWHSGGEPVGLDLDDPTLKARLRPPPGGAVDVSFILLPCSFDVPVIGAVLHDREHEVVAIGFAARPEPADAVLKAAGEAWSLRAYSRGLIDPDGQIWQAVDAGFFDGTPLKPFRPDRRYEDSYRDDYRDVTDLACHSQFYLDPRTHRHLGRALEPTARTTLSRVPSVSGEPRRAYLNRLGRAGIHPVAVDVTTEDVAAAGLRVRRVVAPGLYSNPPAAFPFLGGERLYEEPRRLGLTDGRLAESSVVLTPLPHT